MGDGTVDFVSAFGDAVTSLRDQIRERQEQDDTSSLGALFSLFNDLVTHSLGLDEQTQVVGYAIADGIFDVDLMLDTVFSADYELALDAEDVGLQELVNLTGEALTMEVDAELGINADVDLDLSFGVDFNDLSNLDLFLDSDSFLRASVSGDADDLSFTLGVDAGSLGTFGFLVDDGDANLSADIEIAFDESRELNADENGRIDLDQIDDTLTLAGNGGFDINLPLYFPIKALPVGGTTVDRDGDNYGDNVLHLDSAAAVQDKALTFSGINLIVPEFELKFDVVTALLALLDDPQALLSGLEGFFGAVDVMADGIDAIEIPLIGGAPFDSLAGGLRSVGSLVLGDKTGGNYEEGSLGDWLQDQADAKTSTSSAILDMIRTELFNGLNSLNESVDSELFAFVVPELDEQGNEQVDEFGKVITRKPTSADDIELILTSDGLITFNIKFGGVLVDGELPVDFNAGLPGLNLDVDATFKTYIDYLMGIGLGIGNVAASGDPLKLGVFLDTSGINEEGEEIALDVSAVLDEGSTATGTLGFLKMDFEVLEKSGVEGHFGIDLTDENQDGKLMLVELAKNQATGKYDLSALDEGIELAMNAVAKANAYIGAAVSSDLLEFLPSLSTKINYQQELGRVELSTDSGSSFEFGDPTVILEDVTLDVGSVFNSFLGDTFDAIYSIVKPIKPVVDLLLMEIDLGITTIQFIDLAYLRLPAKTVDTAKTVLEVLNTTIEFLEQVDGLADAGGINFGDFNLTESFVKDPDAETTEQDVAGASTAEERNANLGSHSQTLQGPSQKGLDEEKGKQKNFRIPVLEDPMTVLDFLLGRGEVDLFWYDLPDLALEFEYSKSYPVFPGLNAGMAGAIGAYTNFDFGFDTRGLSQWMDLDFELSESWRIFNGFYLDDHGQENTEGDEFELLLTGMVGVSASLGIGGLVEAGVMGGIEMFIGFDLNDKETEFLNDLPVGDGKFYGSELIERISHGPQCLFDVEGALSVFLEAFMWIGLDVGFSKITLFEARERFVDEVIAEFDWECIHEAPGDIAELNGDNLNLRYAGDNSDGAHNYTVDVLKVDNEFSFENLMKNGYLDTEYMTRDEEQALANSIRNWKENNNGEDIIVVSTGQKAELFLASQVNTITINGTSSKDRYTLKKLNGRIENLVINSGDGDDVIDVYGDAEQSAFLTSLNIHGGNGEDYIRIASELLGDKGISANAYKVYGDGDNDRLKVEGVNANYSGILLDGGAGDDTIMGKDGREHVKGGTGFDVIMTYGGDDLVYGGDENSVATYLDADGNPRVSQFYQADGQAFEQYNELGYPVDSNGQPIELTEDNHMVRQLHGDMIVGGDGNDEIHGGAGFDEIFGGSGSNIIYGDAGNDRIDAGTGSVKAYGGDGDDVISWVYQDIPDGSELVIDGEAGDDSLDVIVSDVEGGTEEDNQNTIVLDGAGIGSLANLTIDGDTLALDQIEHLFLDTQQAGDDIQIGDLLNTSLQTVDVELGSRKATMWQPDRDSNGNHQVYPEEYSMLSRPEYREGEHFYRYSLDEGSRYLFNADGSPQLSNHFIAAERAGSDNRQQQIILADGLNRVELFYGYQNDLTASGMTAQNTVTITADMTAADVETALESLPSIVDVTVSGEGTASSPWLVTFNNATTSGGQYRMLAHHYKTQDHFGSLIRIEDSRTEQLFYRLNDGSAEYLFNDDGSPKLIEHSETVAIEGDAASVALAGWQSHAELRYHGDTVVITQGMSSEELKLALESLDSISKVTVIGDGTEGQPWVITFEDADRDSNDAWHPLEVVIAVQAMRVDLEVPYIPATVDSSVSVEGSVVIPEVIQTATFSKNGVEEVIDLSDGVSADELARLKALNDDHAVTVVGSGQQNEPWTFTFENYQILPSDNPDVIQVQYGTTNIQSDLLKRMVSTYKLAERLDATGNWIVDRSEDGDYAVYAFDTNTHSEDVYLSSAVTAEREGPRLLEKDIWVDDGNGNLIKAKDKQGYTGPTTDWFEDPTWVNDQRVDNVVITGSDSDNDYFQVGHKILNPGTELESKETDTIQVLHQRLNSDGTPQLDPNGRPLAGSGSLIITLHGMDLRNDAESIAADSITLDGAGGDDRIVAGFEPNSTDVRAHQVVSARAADQIVLKGGEGNDRIIGTRFADTIDGGLGDDVITGNGGEDTFVDAGGTDTLIEARDLNFQLSDTELVISGQQVSDIDPTQMVSIEERESMGIFERFELFGGAGNNTFTVDNFTQEAILDGTEGSDTYVMTLTTLDAQGNQIEAVDGRSRVYIEDSGTGSTDSDNVEIWGGDVKDTLHMTADASRQEVALLDDAKPFTLSYQGQETAEITGADTAETLKAKLEALTSIHSVEVMGSGSESDPWKILLLDAQTNVEDQFFRLYSSDDSAAIAKVSRAIVQRVNNSFAESLLDGKPDVDAMFGRPENETQVISVYEDPATQEKKTGSFRLTYAGQQTIELNENTTAVQLKAALEALANISLVQVTGSGDSRDPWRIKLSEANQDSRGNFFLMTVDNTDLVRKPMDIADAAATTSVSVSLAEPNAYQRVYYDFSAENVVVHGGKQDDTFISDDSTAAMYVYGDGGNDSFLVGRVIDVKQVTVDGQKIDVANGPDGVTAGVSFNSYFYGGAGDDYFEVNRNVGELELYGESGDDTFFLKAILVDNGKGGTEEADGGAINAGAGDSEGNIDEKDHDTLIDYVENNRVGIFGGSGFDTVVIAGTALDDEFHIYTDNDGTQYLYGAGLKLENINDVERLALVTGSGDDTVYLYGLDERLSLLLNLGSGDDELIIGGEEQQFDVTYPAANATYTVKQKILIDTFESVASTNYNSLALKKKAFDSKSQEAFNTFYNKWLTSANVTISQDHWRLLEANLTLALKLYAQAVERAYSDPVKGYNLHSWNGSFNASAYKADLDALERALNFSGQEWGQNSHDFDYERDFFGNRKIPHLPDEIDFSILADIVPDSQQRVGPISLDYAFFNVYLREVVAQTIWGDYIHSDQVRRGDSNSVDEGDDWGADPDLYLMDLYKGQLQKNGNNLPHVEGAKENKDGGVFINDDRYSHSAHDMGAELFWDLISLFYEVEQKSNVTVNIEHIYTAEEVDGFASYRFDNLPERTVTKTMAANYDISRIAGVVRLSGGGGDDTITINAEENTGLDVTVQKQTLNLADFIFDESQLGQDIPDVRDSEGQPLITHESIQAALLRINKETDIGVIDRLLNGEQDQVDVTVSVDRLVSNYALVDQLNSLKQVVQTHKALFDIAFATELEDFVTRGLQLLRATDDTSTSIFSLDQLNGLLNSTSLTEVLSKNGGQEVQAALNAVKDYLTLASVTNALESDGYNWAADPALTIYQDNSIDLSDRSATYKYTQEIWDPELYDDVEDWKTRSGEFQKRLETGYESDNEALRSNDINNERYTRELLEIEYTVDGTTYAPVGSASNANDPLRGNTIELQKEYSKRLDNLNHAYYTYSYYGTDGDGNKVLESVAIRRLNGDDAGFSVAGKSVLDGGTYLTADNWDEYLSALKTAGLLSDLQETHFGNLTFDDAAVKELITTALNQSIRDDIKGRLIDGLIIEKDSQTFSVNLTSLKDDSGFYIPIALDVLQIVDETITVSADYVTGKVADTEYTVKYDSVLGLNEQGIWFGSFETTDINLNLESNGSVHIIVDGTHLIENLNVNTGAATDTLIVTESSARTTLNSGAGDDAFWINYAAADQASVTGENGVSNILELDGGEGGNVFNVGLSGQGSALINIRSVSDSALDALNVYGTERDDTLLFRPDAILSMETGSEGELLDNGSAERVNYFTGVDTVTVFGGDGHDTFVFDDTSSVITVYGQDGNDTFRVGQMYQSPRNNENSGLARSDWFETTQVTRGFLSNGISFAASLYGGAGEDSFTVYSNQAELSLFGQEDNDTFLVRSFVLVDPNDPKAPVTNLNGGQGADFINYSANAPVNIAGGDGLDTVTVIGTEFGDDFVIDENGVYGAGRFTRMTGIEKLVIDGLEGNDTFFLLSNNENVELSLIGGLGSDTFNVAGGNEGEPISVPANDLQGHSGLIQHVANGGDIDVETISTHVADDDEAGVIIRPVAGPLRVYEGDNHTAIATRYYEVVLTQAPRDVVRLTASASVPETGAGLLLNGTENGTTLLFDRTNWFKPQIIEVNAVDDSVLEGLSFIDIRHSIMEGLTSEDNDAYDVIPIKTLRVEVIDDEAKGISVVPSGASTLVAEAPELQLTDTYQVVLNAIPTESVTVELVIDGQISADKTILTFDASNWNIAQTVTLTAINDDVTEGIHYSRISHVVTSNDLGYQGIAISDVEVKIADDEAPTLLILESDGSTHVAETGAESILQEGVVFSSDGSSTFKGSFGIAEIEEKQGNDVDFLAQDLTLARWSKAYNSEIASSNSADADDRRPHITVQATGDGTQDYFKITVTQDVLDAGGKLSVDIDHGYQSGDASWWASRITLLDSNGQILTQVVGDGTIDTGSESGLDARLEDYTFSEKGVYYIRVDRDPAMQNGFGVPDGVDYDLHVALSGQTVADFVFTPSSKLENEAASSSALGQEIGSDGQGSHWYQEPNSSIGNVENGGPIDSTTPYITIQGVGNGTTDRYRFDVTEEMLKPVNLDISGEAAQGTWYTQATVSFAGDMNVGDVWTLIVDGESHAYTVEAGQNADNVVAALSALLPDRYSVEANGNDLSLSDEVAGFTLAITHQISDAGIVNRQLTTTGTLDEATLTFAGNVAENDIVTLNLGGESVDYTVKSGDRLSDVVSQLLDAVSELESASGEPRYSVTTGSSGMSMIVTGSAFSVSATVTGSTPSLTLDVEGVPADPYSSDVQWTSVNIDLSGDVIEGQEWLLDINGESISYIVESGVNTLADLAVKLQSAISDASSDNVVTVTDETLTVTRSDNFTASVKAVVQAEAQGSLSSEVITVQTALVDFKGLGINTGDTWTLTLDDISADYTIQSDDGVDDLVNALLGKLSMPEEYELDYDKSLQALTVVHNNDDSAIVAELLVLPNAETEEQIRDVITAGQIHEAQLTLSGDLQAGDSWSFTLDSQNVDVVVSTEADLSDLANTVEAEIGSGYTVEMDMSGDDVILSIKNVTESQEVIISHETVESAKVTGVFALSGQLAEVWEQTIELDETYEITVGDIWEMVIEGQTYSYVVNNGDTTESIITALIDQHAVSQNGQGGLLTINQITQIHNVNLASDTTQFSISIEDERTHWNKAEFSIPKNFISGETFVVTIDGMVFEYLAKKGDDAQSVADGLKAAIIQGMPSLAASTVSDGDGDITLVVDQLPQAVFVAEQGNGTIVSLFDIDKGKTIKVKDREGIIGNAYYQAFNHYTPVLTLYSVVDNALVPVLDSEGQPLCSLGSSFVDRGSKDLNDPFIQHIFDQAGEYVVQIGNQLTREVIYYSLNDADQTIGGETRRVKEGPVDVGVVNGSGYELHISLQKHQVDPDFIKPAGMKLLVSSGEHQGEEWIIASYDPDTDQFSLVSQFDEEGRERTLNLKAGDRYEIRYNVEDYFSDYDTAFEPFRSDSYEVVLSGKPAGNVDIAVAGVDTRTFNIDQAFDDSEDNGQREQLQVSTDLDSVVFTDENWFQKQTITVTAVGDEFVDGDEAQVFAPAQGYANAVRGTVFIDGGVRVTDDENLNNPIMVAGEQNWPQPDGNMTAVGVTTSEGQSVAILTDSTATYWDPEEKKRKDGLDPRMNSSLYEFVVVSGDAQGVVMTVARVDGDEVTFTEEWPEGRQPKAGDSYFYRPVNLNTRVDETVQVDTVNFYNDGSPADQSGTLSSDRILGFGMGDGSSNNGIHYQNAETVNMQLGSGADNLIVESTHAGSTFINTDEGGDRIHIKTISGQTVVSGGEGDDLIMVSSDSQLIDEIASALVIDGGAGNNRLHVDDSGDTRNNTLYLTDNTLTGLGIGSQSEVKILKVRAESGSYVLDAGTQYGSISLAYGLTAQEMSQALEAFFGTGSEVRVTQTGEFYTLTFGGQLAGQDIPELLISDTSQLVAAQDATVELQVETIRQGTTDIQRQAVQLLDIDATAGYFRLEVLGTKTEALAFDASAQEVQAALSLILNPNNTNPDLPHTDNVAVHKVDDGFAIVLQGEYAQNAISHVVSEQLVGNIQLRGAKLGIHYQGVNDMTVIAGSGDDTVNVQSSRLGVDYTINTSAGDDQFHISSTADGVFRNQATASGVMDNIIGDLNLQAGAGSNALFVSDFDSTVGDIDVRLSEGLITGLSAAEIRYDAEGGNFDSSIVVWTSLANDTVTVSGVESSGQSITHLYTSLGSDSVLVTAGDESTPLHDALVNSDDRRLQVLSGDGADVIDASTAQLAVRVRAGEGEDIVRGGAGDDVLFGDADRDILFGGDGDDWLNGETVADVTGTASISNDILFGDHGQITLFTETGQRVVGSAPSTTDFRSLSADDVVLRAETVTSMNAGNDWILTGDGENLVMGGEGDDLISGGMESDILFADTGVADYVSNTFVTSDEGKGDDTVQDTGGSNRVLAGLGDDTIALSAGSDVVLSDTGSLHYNGNVLEAAKAKGVIEGDDQITVVGGDNLVMAGAGNDFIRIEDGDNWVLADNGTFDPVGLLLTGDESVAGDDRVQTGHGLNRVILGLGDDSYSGLSGKNAVIGDAGRITRYSDDDLNVESDSAAGGQDTLALEDGENILIGGAGEDMVTGGRWF